MFKNTFSYFYNNYVAYKSAQKWHLILVKGDPEVGRRTNSHQQLVVQITIKHLQMNLNQNILTVLDAY